MESNNTLKYGFEKCPGMGIYVLFLKNGHTMSANYILLLDLADKIYNYT